MAAPSANDAVSCSAPAEHGRRWRATIVLVPLAFLWFTLINHLRIEWSVNPQYTYGWAVPFLCLYLFWQRSQKKSGAPVPDRGAASSLSSRSLDVECSPAPAPSSVLRLPSGACYLFFFVLALLYAPIRLVQEANPEWRLVSWGLALAVTGLTLLVTCFTWGWTGLRRVAFPAVFFLVAVPWPTVVEAPLIQTLTRLNASGAVEILNLLGTPALRQGNVIEISTGLVGIEDACSGIRSIQACLMIGLFLGAHYRLRYFHRAWLVLAGLAMAVVFNLCRTVLLVNVASRQGMDAIAAWHDPAGVTILVGCFLGVWWIAAVLKRGRTVSSMEFSPDQKQRGPRQRGFSASGVVLGMGLMAWLVVVEVGVEYWYRSHETGLEQRASWTIQLPRAAMDFRDLPFNERTVQFLRFDEGSNASWRAPEGERCQAIFLRWNPGRIAVHLARSHTPEVCLTAAGRQLAGAPETRLVTVDGLSLPFDVYHAGAEGLWVYYCLWEDRRVGETSVTRPLSYHSRLRPVLEGRRNLGQRSLEFAFWTDAPQAEALAQAELQLRSLIRPGPAAGDVR